MLTNGKIKANQRLQEYDSIAQKLSVSMLYFNVLTDCCMAGTQSHQSQRKTQWQGLILILRCIFTLQQVESVLENVDKKATALQRVLDDHMFKKAQTVSAMLP